ncbi:hypothetical protein HY838_01595 [Candidatus Azambacteria bacterium]|nr:hypothetical protein [Candidatus Azambacteria bacterium]
MNETGYKKIANYLTKCIGRDYLSHAYIFYGPDEDSKHKTAFWFADKILKNDNRKFHPDLLSIKPEMNDELSIDLIRQLKNFLTLRPYSNEYKIAIIETAEKLNNFAQNALLKIFEEAPKHAIVILCVNTLDSIADTIISRAVRLPFWRIKPAVSEPDKKTSDIFEALLGANFSSKYNYIEKLNSQKAPKIFKTWLYFLREKFKTNPTKKITDLLAKSQNIYFKLNETNINPKFAYDELLLNTEIKKL